jgi:NAD(P)-dependent dehydrogenase (short-subunit alcohol dehydrogenase family)
MGRFGDAEKDAGAAAAFLASEEAGFVTGVSLRVDGGLAI